jgi:hypothetical protein
MRYAYNKPLCPFGHMMRLHMPAVHQRLLSPYGESVSLVRRSRKPRNRATPGSQRLVRIGVLNNPHAGNGLWN